MVSFWNLLRDNRNYRYTWLGQIVSEVGDHFNSIAVLSLALHVTGTGAAVGGVMIARTLSAIIAAPIAGVALDRLDRKKVMIASDVMRGGGRDRVRPRPDASSSSGCCICSAGC